MKMMSWQTIRCLSTEGRKSDEGENPLMRSITEHSLCNEPKCDGKGMWHTGKREIHTKVQEWNMGDLGQNVKETVCHRGVRLWACFNSAEPWHRS